jgi:hypothetical protein
MPRLRWADFRRCPRARAEGRDEGRLRGLEFAIFRALAEADLLKEVSAFMVEWHRMFDDKTQADLIDPLLDLGFIVFDQSNRTSNGFFYAVRARRRR